MAEHRKPATPNDARQRKGFEPPGTSGLVDTGIVVNGKVIVEGEPLPDGTVVTFLAREAYETFEVPLELEAVLLESVAEADRGDTISADELLQRLRRIA